MNKATWQQLAEDRIADAAALLAAQWWSAAYYRSFHMGTGPLVNEQIEAGARFLSEFGNYRPVKAAFWLQIGEDESMYLCVASDGINHGDMRDAYGEVIRIADNMHDPNFDSLDVKLLATDDPFVRAAIDILNRYPAGRIAPHYRRRQFGNTTVEEVYIYPLPIAVGT